MSTMSELLRQRPRAVIAALTLGCIVAYLGGTGLATGVDGELVQGDARSYFAYLPSLVLDGDVDLRNQFTVLQPQGRDQPAPWGVGPGGIAANPFPVGPALVWLPGYVAGMGLDWLSDGLGSSRPLGYGPGAVWGAAVMTILAVGLGVLLAFEVAARLNRSENAALLAAVAVWLGTPLLYYTIVSPLYSHGVAWFAAALFAALCLRATEGGPRHWLLAGLAGGFLVAVRLQDAPIVALGPALLLLATPGARLPHWAAHVAGGIAGYLPQGYVWWRLYGSVIPIEPHAETGSFSLAKLGSVLLSTGHEGWLTWSPIVLLGGAGLVALGRSERPPARAVALAAAVATAGIVWLDVVHPYGAGSAFGGRRYISLGVFGAIGLAAFLFANDDRSAARARWTRPLAVVLVLYSLWLFVAYELLAIRHSVYGTLLEVMRYGLGLGPPA